MQQRLQMTVVNSSDAVNEWSLDYYFYYRQHVHLSGPLLIYMYIYHSSNFLLYLTIYHLAKSNIWMWYIYDSSEDDADTVTVTFESYLTTRFWTRKSSRNLLSKKKKKIEETKMNLRRWRPRCMLVCSCYWKPQWFNNSVIYQRECIYILRGSKDTNVLQHGEKPLHSYV